MPETSLCQNSYTCYFPKTSYQISLASKADRPCSLTKKKGNTGQLTLNTVFLSSLYSRKYQAKIVIQGSSD